MKGQFMALTAVIVSIMVLSITGMMTEFQNQNYPQEEMGKTLDTIKEEAGKVNINNPEERRNFVQFVESISGYSTETQYIEPQECFDVTIQRTGAEASLNCIGGYEATTEKVRLLSIGHYARDSEGGEAPIPPDGSPSDYGGIYDAENGRQILQSQGSYNMLVYDIDTQEFQQKNTYDLSDSSTGDQAAADFASAIDSLGNDASKIVMITGQNEPQANRFESDLEEEMYDLGASPSVYGASDTNFRNASAYLLVGRPGLGQRNAYVEKYVGPSPNSSHSWAEAEFKLS